MNRSQWFRLSGRAAFATGIFMSCGLYLASGAGAQSPSAAIAGSAQGRLGSETFVVAPSFPLGGVTTSMAIADLNQDGKPDLITANYSSGKVTVFLGVGGGNFAAGVDYAAGVHPGSVLVADIDGDGRPDVVVSNESEGTISVLAGAGNGKLQQPKSFTLGFGASFLAAGDFNGDQKTDLAAVSSSGHVLAILLNDGNGNLKASATYGLRKSPTGIVVADLNNDGHAGIALSNGDGSVSLLVGKGDGSLHSLPDIQVASGALSSIIAGDFDKDGKVDLAVTQSGQKHVSVLMGKGNGAFASPASYAVGNSPASSLMADVDGDGIPDLVVINQGSNSFSVLAGKGDGTFRNSGDFVVGKGPIMAVAGDFVGDGHVDLAVLNSAAQSVSVPLGNGDGTFRAARAYSAELLPRSIASGVVDGSGKAGLAVANYCGVDASCGKGGSVAIFTPGEGGRYKLSSTYPVGSGPVSVALADVDGDKKLDLVVLNRGDKTVSVMPGLGDGSFKQPITFSLSSVPIAFAIGDFNKDGKSDLAIVGDCGAAGCSQPGTLDILTGSGDGNFHAAASYAVGYAPAAIAVGDLNNDKNLDIVVVNGCGKDSSCGGTGTASVFLGQAAGKFTAGVDVALGKSPTSIALANMSGRGVPDLVVSRAGDNTVAVLEGKGDGSFQAPVVFQAGASPRSVVTADFNGDGKPDVAVTNFDDSTVSVLFGKGDGTLQPAFALPVGAGPEGLAVISGGTTGHATLVTANGNTGGSITGNDITMLSNVRPDDIETTATSVSASPNPADVNQAVTLTATVTPVPSGGTVDITDDSAAITGCSGLTVDTVSGMAKCTTSTLAAGDHFIIASYSGVEGAFSSSTSDEFELNVRVAPTITVSTAPTSPAVNQLVTFTVTVSGSLDSPPSGTVSFLINGKAIGDCPPQTLTPTGPGGVTCSTSTLMGGSNSIVASYGGDPNYAAATAPTSLTVTPLAATLGLTSSSGTSNFGDLVTFTATLNTGSDAVTPTAPSGTVSFTSDGSAITGCTGLALSSGTAKCTTKTLAIGSHSIVAAYGGDPSFTAPNSSPVTQVVSAIAAKLTLTAQPASPSNVNQSVVFTATLSATGGLTVAPTGKVTFTIMSGNTTITGCPPVSVNSSGVATCQTSSLIAPSDTVTASYSGDTSYSVSPATPLTQTVNPLTATLSGSVAPSPSSVGQSVTYTVTLNASSVSPVAPSGTVTFTINSVSSNDCPPVTINSKQQAVCTTASTTAPATSFGATYSSDPNFTVAAPISTGLTVNPIAAQTVLRSSSNPSSVNQQVTFTATVSGPKGAVVPTGSVTFTQGSKHLCDAVTLSKDTATASCPFTFTGAIPAPGSTITATYSGDASYSPGTPGTVNQVVGSGGTNTTISGLPDPSAVNQLVNFTIAITPATSGSGTPQSGTVVVTDTFNGSTMTLCSTSLVAGKISPACPAVPFSAAGAHSIVAAFTSTDASFSSSTSNPVTQTVTATGTSTALTSTPNPSSVNQSVTFTATVTPAVPGNAVPAGTVTFTDSVSGDLCKSVALGAGGVAACPQPLAASGPHIITATYSSTNGNFAGSASSPLTQTVGSAGTTTSLTASPNSSLSVNQSVKFTATVTAANSGSTNPGGTVDITYTLAGQTVVLCGGVTVTSGSSGNVASCTAPLSAAGSYSVIATYNGDKNFAGSFSAPVPLTVSPAATSIVLAPTAPTPVNQAVTLSATISAPSGTAKPTGTVTFYEGTQPLCTPVSVSANAASCMASFATAGNHSITAQYSGDSNFSLSNAVAVTQVVTAATTTLTMAPTIPVVATQSVTYTAQVGVPAGPGAPGGTVTFTSSDGSANGCVKVPVTSGAASCTATFPSTSSGAITISAAYSGDSNFGPSNTSVSQMVKNFAVVFSVQPSTGAATAGPVTLTQGYSSDKDPFTPVKTTLTSVTTTGFTDTLNLTCIVQDSTAAIVTDPSCTFNPATLAGNGSGVLPTFTFAASPTAPIGSYTVTVSAKDSAVSTLTQSTTLTLNITGVTGSLTLVSGTVGTENAIFNTGNPGAGTPATTLNTFSCGTIVTVAGGDGNVANEVTCSGPAAGVPVTGGQTTVPITITTKAPTTSAIPAKSGSSSIAAAAFVGVPLLALLGCLGIGKSPRRNFFRFLGLVLLVAGMMQAMGCGGGSFTPPPVPTGGIAPGNYLIQVVATDSTQANSAKYYAVVPLVVNAN